MDQGVSFPQTLNKFQSLQEEFVEHVQHSVMAPLY